MKNLRITILRKLASKGCYGNGHLLVERLKKGIPKEDVGNVKYVLKDLNRSGLVISKHTKHGLAVYLNIKMLKQIEEEISMGYNYSS